MERTRVGSADIGAPLVDRRERGKSRLEDWDPQEVGTNGPIGALEEWTSNYVSADSRLPFCRCCSVFLSPQLYCDTPSLRAHSFLFGGVDRPRYRTVAYPGPCRLRPRLVSGPMPLSRNTPHPSG